MTAVLIGIACLVAAVVSWRLRRANRVLEGILRENHDVSGADASAAPPVRHRTRR